MGEYCVYQKRLKELLLKGLVGFGGGLFFVLVLMGEYGDNLAAGVFLSFLVFTGLPYGWELSGRVLRVGNMIAPLIVILLLFFLRFVVALYGGMFGYPIALIYNFVKMLQEKKSEG